jgi:SEC-C motif-containing protein
MRSRYTAYVRGAIEYLLATHDSSTRAGVDVKAVTRWSKQTMWLGLEIVATDAGRKSDREGVVEFIARGSTLGRPFEQRERSRFRKADDGHWYYVDGDVS